MQFLTPALTAGALLIALPIVLHLVMRREPQPLVFPALRLLQRRRSTNQTRLRLRHWILLALRCLAIALLAFALARPALLGSGLRGNATGEVSAALVFDNSPRMLFRELNQSRLEAAQGLAAWLLEQFPSESRLAVLSSGTAGDKQLRERDSASLRVSRIAVSYRERGVEQALADAIDLLEEREGDRREVYLFTDLAASAWKDSTRQEIARQLDRIEGLTLFLVDVGVPGASNRGVGALELSSDLLTVGQPLEIEAELYLSSATPQAGATPKPLVAELWIEEEGQPKKRAETLVELSKGESSTASFTLSSLDEATHQGFVRIAGADSLEADDARYFTIEVEPPRPVLLVGSTRQSTLFLDQALAPPVLVGGEPNVYETERLTFAELSEARLANFDAVWLLDPPPLDDRLWRQLDDYARSGGSVALALGRRATSAAFNSPAAQTLVAGQLRWKSNNATYLRPLRYDHPALVQMSDFAEVIPWVEFPVFRYWGMKSLANDSLVVAPFANNDAAIIERPIGRGRAITITTPLSDPASDDPWNLLPTGFDPWPFLALVNNLSDYLSGASDLRWNYAAGEPAVLPVPPGSELSGYVLRLPSGEAIKNSQPGLKEIVVGVTDTPGNYRLRAGGQQARLDTGFSVNAPADAGRLERIDFATLQSEFGADRVKLARGRQELARSVDVGRTGRELYPWLIALVALALGAEHLMSNRFYKEAKT